MALNGEVTRQATMVAYDQVFSYMFLTTLLLFPLLFIIRPASAAPAAGVDVPHE